nr:WXG100 family type VII secretion target [Planosporangium thailandense]
MVAARVDQPADPWAGVWIAEDIELIGQGVKNGSWIDTGLGVVGAGLDGLAIVSDPVGALLQYGVAWIIEHVKPLTEALDWLAGDPGQIAGHAQTWRNVAASLQTSAEDAARAVRWDVAEWGGTAGPAYRDWAGQQHAALGALGKAAETMAAITEGAGALIAAVRMLVRDAIATCVSRLIVYAAEEAGSLGLATPLVVEQVSTLVASWAGKIARWLKDLLSSLRRLEPVVRKLSEYIDKLKELLSRLRGKPKASQDGTTLQRVRGKGTGPRQPMNMDSVRQIAAKYGIDISRLRIDINKSVAGRFGRTRADGSIELCRTAFQSEEDLARTLEHEKFHSDELASGKTYPKDMNEAELWEDRAYAHEDDWWKNQPVRPEGTG